jgi:hypothetical protein
VTVEIITLVQAKAHLRVTTSGSDVNIAMKVAQANSIVMDYLKLSALPSDWDSVGSPTGEIPPLVQAAALLIVAELYQNSAASDADLLSEGVRSLLRRYRDPALA